MSLSVAPCRLPGNAFRDSLSAIEGPPEILRALRLRGDGRCVRMVPRVIFGFGLSLLTVIAPICVAAAGDDPKPTPDNTIHVELTEPVKPQSFPRPLKFFLNDVTDRSGNAQPMLVFKPRKGIFLDRTPAEITREALSNCLKSADMLAPDRESADFLLTVYLFKFGLSDSSGMDFFGKVEFAVVVKNPKTGKSQQVTAGGTSIAGAAFRKKTIQNHVLEDINNAFSDAMRNFLRGEKFRDAIATLDAPPDTKSPAGSAPPAPDKPSGN